MVSRTIRIIPLFLLGGAFVAGGGNRVARGISKRVASTLLTIAISLFALAIIVSVATAWASATIEGSG